MQNDTRYKRNANGGLNGLPSGEFVPEDAPEVQAFLESGGVIEPELSPEELTAQTKAEAITKLQALESTQPRATREAVLVGDKTRLQAIEDQIVELRAKLV